MKRTAQPVLLFLGLLTSGLQAQSEPGWWVVSTVFEHLVYAPGPSFLTSLPAGPVSVASDGTGGFYEVGSHASAWGLYHADRIPSTLNWQYTLLAQLNMNNMETIAVDRKRVWLLGQDGDLKYVLKSIPNQVPTSIANMGVLGITVPTTPPRFPVIQCSNGREVIVSIFNTGIEPAHVYALDIEATPIRVRSIVRWPTPFSVPAAVRVGQDGKFLVMQYPTTYEWNPDSGVLSPLSLAWVPNLSSGHQVYFDYDQWSDRIAAQDGGWAFPGVYHTLMHNGPGWTLMYLNSNSMVIGVTSMAPRPFEFIGIGCPNTTGQEPRMGWAGLPLQGQSFSITLRDAEPNGFAFFWLGLSDTFWNGFGPLPFNAAPLGAPGCMLLVSADVPFPVPVDATGHAALQQSVPVNPALAGLQVFAQTASSSTANAFGFSASDALVIRVR